MTYKVLSLKWRPQSFKDVVGQDHVVQTLGNAFIKNRIAQGYIFTGPRGVGKTTTARIVAMALNAPGGPSADFDPNSYQATEIANGRALDVLEIDGASNRGIEEIRNLREQIKFAPMNASYKVIIIDEVHMLTTPAFNALLRTLEEPPSHGKFIFCTTDIHKVPATIISRCQRFDFNRISQKDISGRLSYILKEENVTIDDESLSAISRKADGSMRDALSLMDQVMAFCGDNILYEKVVDALGLISHDLYFEFTDSIQNKDTIAAIKIIKKLSSVGVPAVEIIIGINEHIRHLLYAGVDGGESLLEMNDELSEKYVTAAAKWDRMDLLRIGQILSDLSSTIRRSDNPYLILEMTVLKLLEMDASVLLNELIQKVKKPGVVFPKTSSVKKVSSPKVSDKPAQKRVVEKKTEPVKSPAIGKDDKIEVTKDPKANSEEKDEPLKEDEIKQPITEEEPKVEKLDDKKVEIKEPKKIHVAYSLNDVSDNWPVILNHITNLRPSIGTILENSHAIHLEGGIVNIQLSGQSSFSIKMLDRHLQWIENEILQKSSLAMKLKFSQEENDTLKADSNGKKNESDHPQEDHSETVNKIIELFDGEILRN
ncbi:MAG: DNA polymerase III subunit gamma/tau [Candidatus Marinimicrobia bacterium]|nr:DNA polymerase III subunit gamma/tau [Candidatus Neomarinimicrobiota bacterium]